MFPFGLPLASELLAEPELLPAPSLPLFGFEPPEASAESPEPEESVSPDVSVELEESDPLDVSESDDEFDEVSESEPVSLFAESDPESEP